jgi:hypothetical protein
MARRSLLSLAVSFVTLQGAAIGCGSSGKTATGTGAETGSTNASTSTSTSTSGTGGMTGSSSSSSTGTSSSSTSSGSTTTGTGGQQAGSSNTISWNGGSYYLYGINYPWLTYGADFGDGPWGHLANPAQVQSDMATFAGQGGHFLRWWVWVDGRYDPLFASNGQVTGFDPSFFSDLDAELQYAANNHVYLDLTLFDTSVLDAASEVNGAQEGGHASLVTDMTVQQSFLDNALKPLLQHVAASAYKDYVLAYDIMNEPERLLPGGWGPSADFVTVSQMQGFVKNSASYIHTYGGGALATVGSAAQTWMGLGLDFYCAHYNDGPGEPGGMTPPPPYASLGLDKPCVVEEFTTADVSFGPSDTAEWSAEWWLNTIYDQGYAGAIGWAWHDTAGQWSSFQPVFTAWGAAHSNVVGP